MTTDYSKFNLKNIVLKLNFFSLWFLNVSFSTYFLFIAPQYFLCKEEIP